MKIHGQYQYLLGKNKKQVIESLGQELNYYYSDIWDYTIGKDWTGRKIILLICFRESNVTKIKIKKRWKI